MMMILLKRSAMVLGIAALAMCLQGCLATKIVTVPVKVAYGAGKLAVKGTAAVVRAVVPGDSDKEKDAKDQQPAPQSEQKTTP